MKGAAADMKFCAALWLSLQCQKAFCSMDTVELSLSVWGVVCMYVLHVGLHTDLEQEQKYSFTQAGAREMQSQKEA